MFTPNGTLFPIPIRLGSSRSRGRLQEGWSGWRFAHILLHEMAHIADCGRNRYPPTGSTEEGIHAEIACFGFSIDQRQNQRGPLGPPLMGPWR